MVSRTRSVVLCGLSIALLAVGAAIVVPLGPIPFTAQTLMLFLIMLILTPKEAVIAVAGYLVLGAIGLPIFSAFRGGPGVLLGPTGGFLIGWNEIDWPMLLFALVLLAQRMSSRYELERPAA